MNSKERFEFYHKAGYTQTEEDAVMRLVNNLIEALYIPVDGFSNVTKGDPVRIKHFEIDDREPINWGDLKCCEVKKFQDGSFLVIIDEASPGDCTTFCDYIEKYMKSYGWSIKAETEW